MRGFGGLRIQIKQHGPPVHLTHRVKVKAQHIVALENPYGSVNVNAGQYSNVTQGQPPQTPQPMTSDDKPSWQENVHVDKEDEKKYTEVLKTEEKNTNVSPVEKTLYLDVDAPSGKKTLKLKFKNDQ